MTEQDRDDMKRQIDGLSQLELCRLWRQTPAGTGYFSDRELGEYFGQKMHEAGGFSPSISKAIG